ncbi:MAG: neutral/alkaline non-lysosomal ceramidase N-terminal domain-containing protein [bacterium]|jgi:neutral ceramidase|nr:neutral/alkaline non-lysosomal ceramidase N-terminal domain-containing protein [bacterium]MDD3806366.1 neutral/alkaline non-lysosomal ceramidase N-terminal domain-containing protein [bacterium]MDD4152278.1 neutral/alkaline non-lysosomal ceramidase N-terminal domain-containing protein [bacterium]MDD4558426.1 neutral/alkaline non-lysosomal ceramidase N-terminal domain-containing protein [bacterium]
MHKAGIAKKDITPPPGLMMEGNTRVEGAKGVHDPLFCRALAIGGGRQSALLISLDICAIKNDQVKKIRQDLARRTGLPEGNILVAAIHNHAGPATDLFYKSDPAYMADMLKTAADAGEAAFSSMTDVTISLGTGICDDMAHIRRIRMKDGSLRMNWEGLDPAQAEGPVGRKDSEIIVLNFDSPEGERIATLVNYANHPAILAGDNFLYSRDWPGVLIDGLEKHFGGVAIFFNGATGNINHIDIYNPEQGRGFSEVNRLGHMLLQAVIPAAESASPISDGEVRAAASKIEIPHRRISTEALEHAREVVVRNKGKKEALVDGLSESVYASELLKLAEMQDSPAVLPLQVIAVGDVAVAAIPGEPFAELALDIKSGSPFPKTLITSYANGYQGYIPTRKAFAEGGYEVMPTSLSSCLDEGAAETVVSALLEMLQQLHGEIHDKYRQS